MRVALFGGTFDPIHTAHIRSAQLVADALRLDRVLLMPTFVPPHKLKVSMAPAADRLAMCRLAAKEDARLFVSDMEIRRGGASFTADTLHTLCKEHPQDEWFLLVGADMFLTLGTWYRFEEILAMATVCTVPRDGIGAEALRAYAATLPREDRFYIARTPVGDISSTAIRAAIAAGDATADMLPPSVAAYISEKGLYRGRETMDLKSMEPQFIEIIRRRESDHRFLHSLEVAKSAEHLARRYGGDPDKARVAGLLHDVMKDISPSEQLQIFKDFGILLDDVEKDAQKLWHARAGAAFIEHILHIDDRDLLNAVRYHTTGRAGMSLLEKTVFVADFISADRSYPDVDKMRALAEVSLEDAMRYALRYTIDDLQKKGARVHPDTLAALQELTEGGQHG